MIIPVIRKYNQRDRIFPNFLLMMIKLFTFTHFKGIIFYIVILNFKQIIKKKYFFLKYNY